MRAIWNGRTPESLNIAEMLTALAIYHVYEEEGDDYLETTKNRRLPWVLIRDVRGTVTKDVVFGFDRLFQESVGLLRSAWNEDEKVRNEMKERMESGEFNPALDFVSDPKMKNAIGQVLLRQADIRKGLVGPKAFDFVVEKMPEALKEMEEFVGQVITHAGTFVIQEMQRHSLRPKDVNALQVKIKAIDEHGPVVDFTIDEGVVFSNDQKEESKKDKKDDSGFNPMYG